MKHALTFRGQDYSIPAGYGRCTRCEALLDMETWLEQECPGWPDLDRNDLNDMLAELKPAHGETDGDD